MRRTFHIAVLLFALTLPLSAVTRVSLGYGMQFNSMLNSVMTPSLEKQILNTASQPIVGQSAGTNYRTNWSAAADDTVAPYALVNLPELRVSGDWQSGGNTWGFFTAFGGMVPQTSAYYAGGYQITETKTCSGVDYANCPLAAVGFVSSTSGTGTYDMEIRTALRMYSLTAGMNWSRKMFSGFSGDFTFVGELGLNVQSFNAHTQFAATRCSTGGTAPCAQVSQSRVVQGELNTQSLYAFGPYLGMTLRYEQPRAFWYAELGFSSLFLVTRVQNTGYTNFVGGNTAAFSQTSATLAVDAEQSIFAVLPAVQLRVGMKFGEGQY